MRGKMSNRTGSHMKRLLLSLTTVLVLASCRDGRDGQVASAPNAARPDRELSMVPWQPAADSPVLSDVERQSLTGAGNGPHRQARRATRARNAPLHPVAVNVGTAGIEPEQAAQPVPVVEPTPAPVEIASAGFGHALAAGQSVSSIPGSSMGTGTSVPDIQTVAHGHGGGMIVRGPDNNCSPHGGGAIAINQVMPGRRF
jgi:hypothetical protein